LRAVRVRGGCFSFFQAEDGIRDFHVTGVQTCALPICFTIAAANASPLFAQEKSVIFIGTGYSVQFFISVVENTNQSFILYPRWPPAKSCPAYNHRVSPCTRAAGSAV